MPQDQRGRSGAGTPAALPGPDRYPDLVFAQDYLAHARTDLKLFAIGDDVFGVRKAFSPDSFRRAGKPSRLSPELEELARRCGRAFGLELYGVDIAEDAAGAYGVDVNYFPGYRGVPDAAGRLADYIQKLARV